MIWIIIIFVIIGFIILISVNGSSKAKQQTSPNSGLVKEIQQPKTYTVPIDEIKPDQKPIMYLYDREVYFEDKSYLTPTEARREMNQKKEDGEWLEFEEYGGYMNAIYSGKDDVYIEKIESMTPEQVEKWYTKRMEDATWNTTDVFEAIADKLKPFHEQHLINEMDNLTPGRIEGWVNARKKEGYFFSDLAYEKANKIFSGKIDNRKKRSHKKSI